MFVTWCEILWWKVIYNCKVLILWSTADSQWHFQGNWCGRSPAICVKIQTVLVQVPLKISFKGKTLFLFTFLFPCSGCWTVQRQKLNIIAFIGENQEVFPLCLPFTKITAKVSFSDFTEKRNFEILYPRHFKIRCKRFYSVQSYFSSHFHAWCYLEGDEEGVSRHTYLKSKM